MDYFNANSFTDILLYYSCIRVCDLLLNIVTQLTIFLYIIQTQLICNPGMAPKNYERHTPARFVHAI